MREQHFGGGGHRADVFPLAHEDDGAHDGDNDNNNDGHSHGRPVGIAVGDTNVPALKQRQRLGRPILRRRRDDDNNEDINNVVDKSSSLPL